jgi:hypothetical protein
MQASGEMNASLRQLLIKCCHAPFKKIGETETIEYPTNKECLKKITEDSINPINTRTPKSQFQPIET